MEARAPPPRQAREGALAHQRQGELLPQSVTGGRRERSARPQWQVLSCSSRIRQFVQGEVQIEDGEVEAHMQVSYPVMCIGLVRIDWVLSLFFLGNF